MSSLITDWRKAIEAHLRSELDGVEVLPGGQREGPNRRDKPAVCVFWPEWRAVDRDIALADPHLEIRYWPPISRLQKNQNPRDPEPLEQAAVTIMLAFRDKRKVGDFVENLACYIQTATPNYDPDEWRVDFRVQSVTLHLATRAA